MKNNEWNRLIFMREEYRSIDHGEQDKYDANPSTSILTLNRDTFKTFYERASERVEALWRIDVLRDGIREDLVNNRNVRRALVTIRLTLFVPFICLHRTLLLLGVVEKKGMYSKGGWDDALNARLEPLEKKLRDLSALKVSSSGVR